jgi:hypothetical protein
MYTQNSSATGSTASVLRSTSIALSSTSSVSAMESSIPSEETMHLEHAQKIQEQGNHEHGSLVCPGGKETELSKQTRQVPLVEQQETNDELVAQVDSPLAPTGKVIEVPSKTGYEEATLVPPSVEILMTPQAWRHIRNGQYHHLYSTADRSSNAS